MSAPLCFITGQVREQLKLEAAAVWIPQVTVSAWFDGHGLVLES